MGKEGKGKEKDKSKDKKEKGSKEGKDKKDKKDKGKDKKEKGKDKTLQKILVLERKLETLKASVDSTQKLQDKVQITHLGQVLRCDKDVRIRVGPVIGKITQSTAVVLLEVTLSGQVTVHLIPRDPHAGVTPMTAKLDMPKNRPKAFFVEGLSPGTTYDVVFEGVNAKDAKNRTGVVKTLPSHVEHLRVAAVSCDRPERQKLGETNMWERLAKQIADNEVDVVLHLGDQVYGQDEFIDAQAILRYAHAPRNITEQESIELHRLHKLIKDRMRDVYRFTWNLPFTAEVLARSSNLMIWSDNDLYNDFTIAQEDGKALEPIMIKLGQEVYREYQRALWDPHWEDNDITSTDEFYYVQAGAVGIMVIDMRGNRITSDGHTSPKNDFINDAQWHTIQNALSDPNLRTLIVASEIPFAEADPAVTKKDALKKGLEFLTDHWTYQDHELKRLFELIFDWKHGGGGKKDAIFIGGDIHVGVDSIITDHKHNITVQQLVATPITNHVCGFFPKLEDKFSERFSFVHKPLKMCRNYGYVVCSVAGEHGRIEGKLVAGEPTLPDNHE